MTMTMLHKKISVRQPFFKQSGLDHCARISDLACKEIFGSHAPSSLICLFSGEGATVISNIKFQWNNHMTCLIIIQQSPSVMSTFWYTLSLVVPQSLNLDFIRI